eukprot:11124464-Prorocentrum_lima.AAC.1
MIFCLRQEAPDEEFGQMVSQDDGFVAAEHADELKFLKQLNNDAASPLNWKNEPSTAVSYTHLTLPTICSV